MMTRTYHTTSGVQTTCGSRIQAKAQTWNDIGQSLSREAVQGRCSQFSTERDVALERLRVLGVAGLSSDSRSRFMSRLLTRSCSRGAISNTTRFSRLLGRQMHLPHQREYYRRAMTFLEPCLRCMVNTRSGHGWPHTSLSMVLTAVGVPQMQCVSNSTSQAASLPEARRRV